MRRQLASPQGDYGVPRSLDEGECVAEVRRERVFALAMAGRPGSQVVLWSHWQRYLHSTCERTDDGSLVIPAHLVERWETQMDTPYSALSEEEKESDREQVRRYLPIIADAVSLPS